MDIRAKAEEFFGAIIQSKKTLIEIPLYCSQGETAALLHLSYVKDGILATELSKILDVSLPRVAKLLNSLETKKLIIKTTDKKDKRKIIINITQKGKEIVLNKKNEAINKISKILEKLDEEDINLYIKLAKKIENIIKKEEQVNLKGE